ncbi:alkaline-phosphatase-like protein [Trichophaea hybrida]|nr:alkaline-phosphatase-like protein [Trichophaea hybrida]
MFAKGFFPYKPFLPGLAVFNEEDVQTPAPFNKVVFMVVDALRSDFVFGERSGFKFTQSLIFSGRAIPFTAHATSPTITMPRVKAITTGSIPGFLDVILNFAESDTTSSLAQQDNWLAQIKANGGKLVMYGDDTWIKLFPGMFTRSDGTSSFFVSDFTEVDNNVTRHIDDELARDDWNAMVLHYLGLDHIGHKSGPQSAFMLPKQVEMDGIVERIYTAIETQPHLDSTLFVLAGDHGMNDAGNHGGSGEGETSPALVFMSPKLKTIASTYEVPLKAPTKPRSGEFGFYDTIEQSDLAPVITSLLGLPVPRNNLGVFMPKFLQLWKSEERVDVMMRNARQLRSIVVAAYPEFERLSQMPYAPHNQCGDSPSDVEELACLWREATYLLGTRNRKNIVDTSEPATAIHESLWKLCTRYQQILSGVASNYDLRLMTGGIALMVGATILSVVKLVPVIGESSLADLSFLAITVAYGVMMFASSFVEEEHHFWYWVATGWFMLLFLKERRKSNGEFGLIFVLTLLRIIRRWNQTGQKYAGAPDIVKSYFPEHTTILWVLIILTYFDVFVGICRHGFRNIGPQAAGIFAFTTTMAAFGFKLSFAAYDAMELVPTWLMPGAKALTEVPLVNQARAVFGVVGAGMLYTICESNSSAAMGVDGNTTPSTADQSQPTDPVDHIAISMRELTDIFLLTQTRFANTPLILLFRLISRRLESLKTLSAFEITLTILILQHVSFFALGGANAISSVDLSNAYNGVAGYNMVIVGFLTFVSNWVGPIFWASAAPMLLRERRPADARETWKKHVLVMTTFFAVAGLAVMAACTALRTHLFIWTVFSPKYLYLMTWSLGFHIVAGIGWGSFMIAVSRK